MKADPPLKTTRMGTTVSIERLNYSFAEGRFSVEAHHALLPDSVVSWGASKKANEALLPLLPEKMRQPGYDPRKDGGLADALTGSLSALGGTGAPLADLHVSASLSLPRDLTFQIPGNAELTMKANSSMEVSVNTRGSATAPRLESANFRGLDPGAVGLRPLGGDELHTVDLRNLDVDRDPAATGTKGAQPFRVRADYDLGAEKALGGGFAALLGGIGLVGMAVGNAGGAQLVDEASRLETPTMKEVRRDIDQKVKDLAPQLAQFLRQFDGVVPGINMDTLLR